MFPTPARACNVPVFRYALERWVPDSYEIVVFHEGLDADRKKLIASLQDYVDRPDGCPTNVGLTIVDVTKKMSKPLEKLFDGRTASPLPWLVVSYPETADINALVYEGPLDGALLHQLFDSPLRRALADKLLLGETAVWILVESGNKQKDDDTADRLRATLTKLEKTLKLPELTKSPDDKLRTDVALKIEFSLLRVSRQDPAEAHLVRMLLAMEDDLEGSKEPIVFPVFGRGMALWALVGKGITEKNITRAAQFLVGPCSCEIKAQNPGVDLLLTANWEDRLTGRLTKSFEMPQLTGLIAEPVAVKSEHAEVAAAGEKKPAGTNAALWRNVVLALGAGLVLLIVCSTLVFAKKRT